MESKEEEKKSFFNTFSLEDFSTEEIMELLKGHGKEVIVASTAAGVILLFIVGSTMVVNALIIAGASVAGGALIYVRLPEKVQKFLMKFNVILDVAMAALTYILFGQTATAILAAGLTGVLTSALLSIASEKEVSGRPILIEE